MADTPENTPAVAPVETPVTAPTTPTVPTTPAAPEAQKNASQSLNDVFLSLDGGQSEQANKIVRAKGSKNITAGLVHVTATFNNTIVTITDRMGNVIGWSSAGKMGFRGSRKGTAYAAQVVSQDACRQAMGHGLKEVEVRLRGPGSGRESAVRAVQALGVEVLAIKDVTPTPHNGCRPPMARRV
jgi:small subunit ribosomal protein S11